MPHDKSSLILIGLSAAILLLAAFGLFLAKSPDAPLPWVEPTSTSTDTPLPPTATETRTATSTGTRRPTRTPVSASSTPAPVEPIPPSPSPTLSQTSSPIQTIPPGTVQPSVTSELTTASPTPSLTAAVSLPPPTSSPTPHVGPASITGKVVDQGAPIANVEITLEGADVLTATTDAQGSFQFEVDWIGEDYSVVFSLETNSQLSPASDYVLWSWMEAELTGDIQLPDLEISNAPDGVVFKQVAPANGSSISAAQITAANPLSFEWTTYPQADEYWVDLGLDGDISSAWASVTVPGLQVDFDGTLLNGTRINPGTYWWAVGSLRTEGDLVILTYSQTWTLLITP